MFGIVLICVLISDLCLIVTDDDEDVVCIEAPVLTNAQARTLRPVARNGGVVLVLLNGEGSKSATTPDRAGQFKKQRKAHHEYHGMLPRDWSWEACSPLLSDAENIDFDIYKQAGILMELSCMELLQNRKCKQAAYSAVPLWQFKWQATSSSNGYAVYELLCPMRHMYNCKVGLRIVKGP